MHGRRLPPGRRRRRSLGPQLEPDRLAALPGVGTMTGRELRDDSKAPPGAGIRAKRPRYERTVRPAVADSHAYLPPYDQTRTSTSVHACSTALVTSSLVSSTNRRASGTLRASRGKRRKRPPDGLELPIALSIPLRIENLTRPAKAMQAHGCGHRRAGDSPETRADHARGTAWKAVSRSSAVAGGRLSQVAEYRIRVKARDDRTAHRQEGIRAARSAGVAGPRPVLAGRSGG